MQLTKLHEDFYQIDNMFTQEQIDTIQEEFVHKQCWKKLSQGNSIREEGTTNLVEDWEEIHDKVNEYFATTCYPNPTQLWYDWDGYINEVHKDLSPNLSANLQIYLSGGAWQMGTYCNIDGTWYNVPYKFNCGYLMFNPTIHEHGMKNPVIEQRMSMYQSFRVTEEPSPIW